VDALKENQKQNPNNDIQFLRNTEEKQEGIELDIIFLQ
jgi:hypothetical protein